MEIEIEEASKAAFSLVHKIEVILRGRKTYATTVDYNRAKLLAIQHCDLMAEERLDFREEATTYNNDRIAHFQAMKEAIKVM